VAVFYADTSALVKLVREEAESDALRVYLRGSDLVSSEFVLTEIPRAVRRAVALDPALPLGLLLDRTGQLVDALALRPADRPLLAGAGSLAEPALRALDAIHVASAVGLGPIEAFVTYDERQAAAARLAGLRTVAPGVPTA
jgi:predicted nucleic acid-binding protein